MRPNFYVSEYFHHKLATLVAPPTDGTAICLVRYKALYRHLADVENRVQIHS